MMDNEQETTGNAPDDSQNNGVIGTYEVILADALKQQIVILLHEEGEKPVSDIANALTVHDDYDQGTVSKRQVRKRLHEMQAHDLVDVVGKEENENIQNTFLWDITDDTEWWLTDANMLDSIKHPPSATVTDLQSDLQEAKEDIQYLKEHAKQSEKHAIAFRIVIEESGAMW